MDQTCGGSDIAILRFRAELQIGGDAGFPGKCVLFFRGGFPVDIIKIMGRFVYFLLKIYHIFEPLPFILSILTESSEKV